MSGGKLLEGGSVRREQRLNGTSSRYKKAGFFRSCTTRTKLFVALLIILVVVAVLIGYFVAKPDHLSKAPQPPDPVTPPPPSASKLQVFQRAAVCTDAPRCSEIGREVLARNGSAVDAAIAAMFCNGLLNQQSMGIGGGFFMVVYIKQEQRAYSVAARETAPAAATKDMFQGSYLKASKGGLAVGVPGEVRGMWAAHQRWGQLPWRSLIEPTLRLCTTGYKMSAPLYHGVLQGEAYIKNDVNLRAVYYDSEKGEYHPAGTMIKPAAALCGTLQRIADKGGDDFYNGSLAADLVEDLQQAGSIITAEDISSYRAKISNPIAVRLSDGDTLYTSPPPSSGVLLAYILNILSGYNFTADSIQGTQSEILTYHRIIEAFKFAFATRTKLGDDDFLELEDLVSKSMSADYATEIRQRINDSATSNDAGTYGAEEYSKPDSGTAHISILADNGDAVSVTSSLNFYFGACFTTKKTGIVMNDVMDDFSSPGITNYFGVKPSPANFIEPRKRPLSSMTPSIIVDRSGNVKLVIGASGGTRITSSVALVTLRTLWLGQSLKAAVDAPRLHHQLFPMDAEYEYGITADVVNGLRAKGHKMVSMVMKSIVCGLFRNGSAIYGNADFRKGGDVAGIN